MQGSGHCAYVRATAAAYSADQINAYSLVNPLSPKMTDMEPGVGGSESMRAQTVEGRVILVSGKGTMLSDRADASSLPDHGAERQALSLFVKLLKAWAAIGFKAPKLAIGREEIPANRA
jgi:hypothetical protein